jgi:hypothetical protein
MSLARNTNAPLRVVTSEPAERPPPPRSIDLEQAVIAAVTRNNGLIRRAIAAGLTRDHFIDPLLGSWWELILRRHAQGKPTDARILHALAKDDVEREEVGKVIRADLTDNIEAYIAELKNLTAKRLQIIALEEALAECYCQGVSAIETSEVLITRLRSASQDCAPPLHDLVFGGDAQLSTQLDIRPGIPPRAAVGLVGRSRSGKSTYIIDNMVSLANDPKEPGASLYVPLEGRAGIAKRLRAAECRHGPVGNRFAYYTGSGTLGTTDPTFANTVIAMGKAVAAKASLPLKLITIDTVSRALSGEDENSAAVMTALLNHVESIIAETGASVVLVAHPGKDKERGLRGSSALFAGLDAVIEIEHDGEPASARNVVVRKAKDGPEGPIGAFTLETVAVGVNPDGSEIDSCNIRPCASEDRRRRIKPGSAADKALKELHELVISKSGVVARGHARAPDGVWLIPLERWREKCRRKRLSTGKTDVENRAFLRAVDTLTDAGRIGEFDGHAWMLIGHGRSMGGNSR